MDKTELASWKTGLERFADGYSDARVEQSSSDPALEELRALVNTMLNETGSRLDAFHDSVMEMATGLTDVFQVLSDVQQGRFDVRVSEETIGSTEQIIANVGTIVNEMVDSLAELTQRQEMVIRELSTPVLQVWDGIIALPIVGVVDTRRSVEIMDRLLHSIKALGARHVILDITGVEVVDTRTADYLLKIVRAAELLGAHCVLTGVQPAVAETLVGIGVDLSAIRTLRNLQAGLRHCLLRMRSAG